MAGFWTLLNADPALTAFVVLGLTVLSGGAFQWLSGRAGRKKDKQADASERFALIDQQRDLITELRKNLDEAWQECGDLRKLVREKDDALMREIAGHSRMRHATRNALQYASAVYHRARAAGLPVSPFDAAFLLETEPDIATRIAEIFKE